LLLLLLLLLLKGRDAAQWSGEAETTYAAVELTTRRTTAGQVGSCFLVHHHTSALAGAR